MHNGFPKYGGYLHGSWIIGFKGIAPLQVEPYSGPTEAGVIILSGHHTKIDPLRGDHRPGKLGGQIWDS